jgi:hypothetical protein
MSGAWYAAFALVALLSIANGLLLIAVLRQIGVLHERNGSGDANEVLRGVQPGAVVARPHLEVASGVDAIPFSHPTSIIAYVQPGCASCRELPAHLESFLRALDPREEYEVLLVTDADESVARQFSERSVAGASLPLFRSDDVIDRLGIPSSPFSVVVESVEPGALRVLASGVTAERAELEALVNEAEHYRDGRSHPTLDPASGPSALALPQHASGETPAQKILLRHMEEGAVE